MPCCSFERSHSAHFNSQIYWLIVTFSSLNGRHISNRARNKCMYAYNKCFGVELNATELFLSCIINNSRAIFCETTKSNGKWNELKWNGIKIDQCLKAIQMLIEKRFERKQQQQQHTDAATLQFCTQWIFKKALSRHNKHPFSQIYFIQIIVFTHTHTHKACCAIRRVSSHVCVFCFNFIFRLTLKLLRCTLFTCIYISKSGEISHRSLVRSFEIQCVRCYFLCVISK